MYMYMYEQNLIFYDLVLTDPISIISLIFFNNVYTCFVQGSYLYPRIHLDIQLNA
jgi:hypothetical protein